jgi:hypothetical protein
MKYSNDSIYIYCLEIFTRLFILSVTFLYRLRINSMRLLHPKNEYQINILDISKYVLM